MGYIRKYKNAFKLSQEIHSKYVNSYPVDIFDVISNFHNINIVKTSECTNFSKIEEGMSFRCDDKYIIVYNDNKPPNRIKFTIAHELGHILLGHLEYNYKDLNERTLNNVKAKFEYEADTFASNLLAPPQMIDYAEATFNDFEYSTVYIANLFCISEQCAKVRLADYEEWCQLYA